MFTCCQWSLCGSPQLRSHTFSIVSSSFPVSPLLSPHHRISPFLSPVPGFGCPPPTVPGAAEDRPGNLSIMDTPTEHWVEILSGLCAAGCQLTIGYTHGAKQGTHAQHTRTRWCCCSLLRIFACLSLSVIFICTLSCSTQVLLSASVSSLIHPRLGCSLFLTSLVSCRPPADACRDSHRRERFRCGRTKVRGWVALVCTPVPSPVVSLLCAPSSTFWRPLCLPASCVSSLLLYVRLFVMSVVYVCSFICNAC